MTKFVLGVLATLAIMYPAVTKSFFSEIVDTTNTVVVTTINKID